MKKFLALVTLVFLAPVLAELISGSRPFSLFIQPGMLLFFILIGYGLPVLILREFFVRYRFGLQGMFLVGMGYGVLNEGLLAKTMIMVAGLPIAQFDHYGYAFGISWLWSLVIMVWHAFISVLFPILLTHHWYPHQADRQWLGKKTAGALAVLLMAIISVDFLKVSEGGIQGTPSQLVILLGIMLIFTMLGIFFKGSVPVTSSQVSIRPVWLGLSILPMVFITATVAGFHLYPALFVAYFVGVVWLYVHILRTRDWVVMPNLLIFAVGIYMQSALFAVLVRIGFQHAFITETLLTTLAAEIIFLFWIKNLQR
jgi:hypothetical protein